MPTKILGDPVELDRHLIENGYAEVFAAPPSTNYETPFIYTGRPSELHLHVSKLLLLIKFFIELYSILKFNVYLILFKSICLYVYKIFFYHMRHKQIFITIMFSFHTNQIIIFGNFKPY